MRTLTDWVALHSCSGVLGSRSSFINVRSIRLALKAHLRACCFGPAARPFWYRVVAIFLACFAFAVYMTGVVEILS